MQTQSKKAIELVEGDVIEADGTFPYSLYKGTVKSVVVIDAGVQIELEDGGSYIRAEDHSFTVRK